MKTITKIIFLIITSCIMQSRVEAVDNPGATKNHRAVLLLFTPGLDAKNISGFSPFLTRRKFKSFSKFPLINFLEILLGAKSKNQLNSRFFKGGKKVSLQRAQLQKLSWLDLAKDFLVFAPYSKLLKSTEVKKRTISPGRISVLVRERKLVLGRKFIFFVKPRGNRPGAKWTAIVRKEKNKLLLELPRDISVFGNPQNIIELKKGKGMLLQLNKGNRIFNLYFHVRDFSENTIIIYQKGPQKGIYTGKPDYTGLKNEYIGSSIFGGEFLSSLEVIFRNIMVERRSYNLLFLDFAAELEKYLMRYDQKDIVEKWKNIAGKKLGQFLKKWKVKNPRGQIHWIGMSGLLLVEKRLDLGQLLESDKFLLLENGSEALLYPWGFRGNIWEFYHYISKKLGRYKKLKKYWQLIPGREFIKVKLKAEYRAGSCRRGSIVCDDYSGGNWGYPRVGIMYYTNDNNLPGELRSPAELGEHFFYGLKEMEKK
ncbi:MAG: hypothetical protein ACQES9_09925 [Myxococcota bacterium]